MRKCLMLLSILILSATGTSASNEWLSPIDKKYQSKNSALFFKFDQARDLLDSWAGQQEKLQEADRILRSILEEDVTFAPAYREYGRLFIMAGHINSNNFKDGSLGPAEASILKSIEIEPEYADSYVLLGHLYTNMKRYDDAELVLVKAEEIGTETPWLQLNWGELLKKRGEYSSAMERYQSVINKGTPNKKAYGSALNGITTIYIFTKEYDKANTAYLRELEYDPDHAWTWGNYSRFLLFGYKDVDRAIETGRKAIQLMDYGMGRFTLACALYTKWAMLKDNPATALLAQQFFDEAWNLYPYLERVIEETQAYSFTRVTSVALSQRLSQS
ncbi:MAG: tetratricopeptide repeat protein [Pseudomonadota bacterium]